MDDDKLRLSRTRLPLEVKQAVRHLTKTFEKKDVASIQRQLEGRFVKLERKYPAPEKK